MNWIKIDHENLEELPLGERVKAIFDNGNIRFGEFTVLQDELEPEFTLETERGYLNIEYVAGYKIIEKPKKRKYNSIGEFFDKSDLKPDISYSKLGKIIISVNWYCFDRKLGDPILKWKNFFGEKREDCEQQVLEWANGNE